MKATISPWKARTAASSGFWGSRSTMNMYQGLAWVAATVFWMAMTDWFCAKAARSKARPAPGFSREVRPTATSTARKLNTTV